MPEKKSKPRSAHGDRLVAMMARDVAAKYPDVLSRDALRTLLIDREWHALGTLVQLLLDKVPFEVTSQFYVHSTNNKREQELRRDTPEDKQHEAAMTQLLYVLLAGMTMDGGLERRYADPFTEFRLTWSYCPACGHPASNSPGDGKCKRCFAKGWYCTGCGAHVEGSITEKEALCETCAKARAT